MSKCEVGSGKWEVGSARLCRGWEEYVIRFLSYMGLQLRFGMRGKIPQNWNKEVQIPDLWR